VFRIAPDGTAKTQRGTFKSSRKAIVEAVILYDPGLDLLPDGNSATVAETAVCHVSHLAIDNTNAIMEHIRLINTSKSSAKELASEVGHGAAIQKLKSTSIE
jgi:hypothetical protein